MLKRLFRKIRCTNECHWREVRIEHLKAEIKRKAEAVELLEKQLAEAELSKIQYYLETEKLKRLLELEKQAAHHVHMMIGKGGGFEKFKAWSQGMTAQQRTHGGQIFSQDEIKTLIRLCHPDKHQGRESAVNITQKLLSMRNNPR